MTMPFAFMSISRIVRSITVTLLHHGDRSAHPAARLEEAKQHDVVGKVGRIDRRRHRAHHARLRQSHNRDYALLTEKREKLMQLRSQEFLLWHRVQISVEAVDDDELRRFAGAVAALHHLAHDGNELSRRKLGRVDLL